jgi:hypothetical protein
MGATVNTSGQTPAGRIRKLEALYTAPRICETCHGCPVRFVWADPETEEPWHENYPETGCPDCGTPLKGREQWIMFRRQATGSPRSSGRTSW